ncbi:MAG: epimerase [Rickettsiales bacterium]|nr:epimerase [Rickettsiales bacterium]|tara:strand:+ start:12657 stop:13628 length:972 start_codon:yes stop_codon:yes gene_type:complete
MKNERVFITGGAGFVGSLLAERLSNSNEICVFDTFQRDALKNRVDMNRNNLSIVKGDILDYGNLKKAIQQFEPTYVVHCAAIAGIDSVIKSPTSTMRVNIVGTANLLDIIHSYKTPLKRVVLFSTSEIFGSHAFQSSEKHSAVIGAVGEARWTYAVSKLADEHFGLAYNKEFNMPCTVVRPFNVYGPGQVGEGALSIFIQKALKNEPITIHGQGNQIRSWCYVDDMVEGVYKCLTMPEAIGESFNIGNVRAVTTILGLANTVCRVLNSQSKITFSGKIMADIELRIPDVSKAFELLDFEAKIDLEEGISKTAEYYSKYLCIEK